ncbi:MAG: phosphate/phosphite/phosphonate ABC transporter substrate-binding protein [Kiritimatiellaeota bacterium]|nr:phosphate/phosphite/phosphonate ABC transporter substrate-binding protein [Kiritimatiellota bacterium]
MKTTNFYFNAVVAVVVAFASVWGTLLARRSLRLREPYVPLSDPRRLSVHLSSLDAAEPRLRFGVATMLTPEATFTTYHKLIVEVCRRAGVPFRFVVRPSYFALRQALERSDVDVAFVCTGTYLRSDKAQVRLLVRPEYARGWEYRAVVLVRLASDYRRVEDLAGRVMAFSDPESFTGCLVPSVLIASRGAAPRTYFRKVVFTGSHDRSVLAVSRGVADAASVDALVWTSLSRQEPNLVSRLRVLWRSPRFGEPPVLASSRLKRETVVRLQKSLLSLNEDSTGREILRSIGVARFVPATPDRYESAEELYRRFRAASMLSWP